MAAPAPATTADFNIGTGKVSVDFACAAPPCAREISVADLVFSGSGPYMDLVRQGQAAPSKTPGYPDTTSTVNLSGWPEGTDVTATSSGTSIQYWDVRDSQGQLKQLVYTDASGSSNVLFRSSTANMNHVVSLTPGGSKITGDAPAASMVPMSSEEEGWSVTVYVGGSSLIVCCCALVITALLLRRK